MSSCGVKLNEYFCPNGGVSHSRRGGMSCVRASCWSCFNEWTKVYHLYM